VLFFGAIPCFRIIEIVYIKHLELSRFKSFGNTTGIPLLTGFTVVSGPNGSGKSNILDALLFALGLSSSKGMRADRLPDLVNQTHSQKGRTAEAQVKVTFALDDQEDSAQEWTVTRKLRVTQQGTYTSTYYLNDAPCTLTELHGQLSKFHIYPEGYNIVLQGDVTGIISMNGRDRRGIIDELAGVGEFDRKIGTAKDKLDEVKLQEEKFRIVEQELIANKEKLKADRAKAEKYQALREELHQLELWQVVLQYRQLESQIRAKQTTQNNLLQEQQAIIQELDSLAIVIDRHTKELEELNQAVRALGEEEFLALNSTIVGVQAELRNLERQQQDGERNLRVNQEQISHLQTEMERLNYQVQTWTAQLAEGARTQQELSAQYAQKQAQVADDRQQLQALGTSANQYLQQQSELFQQIELHQFQLEPQKQELTRLEESLRQWEIQLQACRAELQQLPDIAQAQAQLCQQQSATARHEQHIQAIAQKLSSAQSAKQVHQETSDRLWQEQRSKSRQLDKLEAQQQATKEVQGTRASQLILNANLKGVYGLVAHLGRVQAEHQLALEICAGNRLSFIVVANDEIASQGIQLLKQERAGRATFLPLNKLKRFFSLNAQQARLMGAIDYAVNLVEYDEQFHDVFGFVFGNTIVFPSLQSARPHLGNHRMVTLEGDLLETTGAMSGGSIAQRDSIHFGKAEGSHNEEIDSLRARLSEIEITLQRLQVEMQVEQSKVNECEQELKLARQAHSEAQRSMDRLQAEVSSLEQTRSKLLTQIQKLEQSTTIAIGQKDTIYLSIHDLEAELNSLKEKLQSLEKSSAHSHWQALQAQTAQHEAELQATAQALTQFQQQQQQLENRRQLAESQAHQIHDRLVNLQKEKEKHQQEIERIHQEINTIHQQLAQLEQQKDQLQGRIGSAKEQRDRHDRQLRQLQHQQKEQEWQVEKLQQQSQELSLEIVQLSNQLEEIVLPDATPPAELSLAELQDQQKRIIKKMQALEPVNMLAIAEYESTTARLDDLTHKLETLLQERSELLLRIENFTTLRQRSFMEAFNAVNENFQTIFAELSDGDGYLQLENPHDPLSGGLNLVAHPKGKPVQHLSSMSGGEKSLTALSFIFALQRYRPSPFYAFDEVDMFLDGANVERLSRMVQKQAKLAQFIVVSLRRPMIDAADRTIGVTQARGAYTQVIGFERNQSA
jgi:chromosome segregation protein